MVNFDEAVEIALRTWYPKDHPLHSNPHHPLGKLLGEWGELLDDYMKSLYKPGYVFDPEDELGDIWYYLRIACYQKNITPRIIENVIIPELNLTIEVCNEDNDILIKVAIYELDQYLLVRECSAGSVAGSSLLFSKLYSILLEIAKRYNLTLDQLTASNWQKLKPGSKRGEEWMKARVSTDYTGGKVSLE